MIKYLILLHTFLLVSFSSLYSMDETTNLPKNVIKDLIINYQIDEPSTYLAQLLSLPRTTINKKLSKSLTKYTDDLKYYSDSRERYTADLKETSLKLQQTTNTLTYAEKTHGKNSEPYKVLLLSLKIQEYLIKRYESLIEQDKFNNLVITQDTVEKMTLLLEALYLTAVSKEQLQENQKLYRQLSLKFHPDKTSNDNNEIQQQKNEFFTTLEPLLNSQTSNTSNSHLNDIIKSIREKRNEIIEQINNPSALTYAGRFLCSTALPVIGEGIGIALCHKTFAQVMPRSAEENILHDICITNARSTALEIETKLVKLSGRL